MRPKKSGNRTASICNLRRTCPPRHVEDRPSVHPTARSRIPISGATLARLQLPKSISPEWNQEDAFLEINANGLDRQIEYVVRLLHDET